VNLTDKVIDVGEITFNVWSYTLEIEVTKRIQQVGFGRANRFNTVKTIPKHVTGKASRLMFGNGGL